LAPLMELEKLVVTLSEYRKTDPSSTEEEEFVENLFDSMCCCLLQEPNRKHFLQSQGIEMMLIMIKGKRFCRKNALKALDFCLVRNPTCCTYFVEKLGLKTLFSAFMKKGTGKNKKGFIKNEDDEHSISCTASLFFNLPEGELKKRLYNKFLESDFEKVDRLMELHDEYSKKILQMDEAIQEEKEQKREKEEEEADEEEEGQYYLRRLEAGLFTLQLVDVVLAFLCASEHTQIKKRIEQLMHQQYGAQGGSSFDYIKTILLEYAENLGEKEDDKDQAHKQKKSIMALHDLLSPSPNAPDQNPS